MVLGNSASTSTSAGAALHISIVAKEIHHFQHIFNGFLVFIRKKTADIPESRPIPPKFRRETPRKLSVFAKSFCEISCFSLLSPFQENFSAKHCTRRIWKVKYFQNRGYVLKPCDVSRETFFRKNCTETFTSPQNRAIMEEISMAVPHQVCGNA